jgi:hypothetical protein
LWQTHFPIVANGRRWLGRVTQPAVVMLDDYLEPE